MQLQMVIDVQMRNKLPLFGLMALFLIGLIPTGKSQQLIESTFLESRTKESLESEFGPTVISGVDMYKILYATTDLFGIPDTASGLVVIPKDLSNTLPILSYQHGTVNTKQDVPSNLRGGYELPMVWGSLGYICSAADFLGLGNARGFHPYLHAETEARAAIDMLPAVEELLINLSLNWNEQLFITGYSQGGHAALATHKFLELNESSPYQVTASVPMSGPYSLSDVFLPFILAGRPYSFPNYLVWQTLSYRLAYQWPHSIPDIFKPEFVGPIEQYENGTFSLNQLNQLLKTVLNDNYGGLFPKYMFQDSIIQALETNPDHPFSKALKDNDLVDWAPNVPTRLLYCTADDQVYYRNSVVADSLMNLLQAKDLAAVDVDSEADHGGCIVPAVLVGALFFQQFKDNISTSTTTGLNAPIEWFPNPANRQLIIKRTASVQQVSLTTLGGEVIQSISLLNNIHSDVQLDVSTLPNGLYLLKWTTNGHFGAVKVVIQH